MKKKKNIEPTNDDGNLNGYCEVYFDNGNLDYKGIFINGDEHGYQESYFEDGKLFYKGLIIKDKFIGYVERTSFYDLNDRTPTHYIEYYIK